MKSALKFQAGGTLKHGTSVYVKRHQDELFLDCINEQPSWVNIHGCRTMGKSSLYAQYLTQLKSRGVKIISVDMGAQVDRHPQTGRDWVLSLGAAIAADPLIDSYSLTKPVMSLPHNMTIGMALERLFIKGLLRQCKGPILLILDEYDYIKELDHCDEVISGLRHIQSLQAQSKSLDRLSICFVGWQPLGHWGTPGSASTSPFANEIEMLDFEKTPKTIDNLMRGFLTSQRPTESALYRTLDLSGGQPLVTMELLREVRKRDCRTPESVELVARDLVGVSGRGKDLQLFKRIEEHFESSGGKGYAALNAYESLLLENKEAHTAPDIDLLLLFGLVRQREDKLEVKGELFRRRFDVDWARRTRGKIASGMQQHRGGVKSKGKKICVINTGGTLGMVQRGDKVVPPLDEKEFKGYFTELDSIAEVVEFTNLFSPRDSINVFPTQWSTIARYIYDRRNEGFDGFVVAHGTDTMAYSASAVAFALGPQLHFPVVFTGAQTTPDVPYGDAHVNLYRACEVAKQDIPEVVICFGNFVYRAVRAQKKDDRRFDGFESPTYPPLAEITGEINVRRELLRPLSRNKKDIVLRDKFEELVLIVPQVPGLEPSFFDHLLQGNGNRQGCRGVIVQTLGAGNVTNELPYSFIPFVEDSYKQGIPVIVTSQYPPDPGTHTKYTPAEAPIKAGAIHAGNMTLAAAVTKFRWVLADVHRRRDWRRMTPDKKREMVLNLMVGKSVVGEF